MIEKLYADYAWEQTAALLAIDSPSGFTAKAAQWVRDEFNPVGCGQSGLEGFERR